MLVENLRLNKRIIFYDLLQSIKKKKKKKLRTSHAWKKLSDGTNFTEPVIASFFGIRANITCFKVLCQKSHRSFREKNNLVRKEKVKKKKKIQINRKLSKAFIIHSLVL